VDLTTAKQRIEYLVLAAVALVPFIFFPVGKPVIFLCAQGLWTCFSYCDVSLYPDS